MSSGTIAVIVAAVVVIALVGAALMMGRRRRLQRQFGPEYDRAVAEQGSRMQAEADLTERQRRVRKLDIRPLSAAARSRYRSRWLVIQERFVDTPQAAVTEAYDLVTEVMQERGYPVTDDEQVADDLSVEHARTVDHFRTAHSITREVAHGSVATEDLRQAVIHYRELFSDLLGDTGGDDELEDTPGRHRAVTSGESDVDAVEPVDARAIYPYAAGPSDQETAGGGKHAVAPPDGTPVTDQDMQPQGYSRR